MTKRPIWLIILTCFILLYQIFWFISVLQLPDDLKTKISLSIPYEMIVSFVVVIFFMNGLRALILTRSWAIGYTIGGIIFLWAMILLRLIVFVEADYDRQRLPFLIMTFVMVCGLAVMPKLMQNPINSTKGEFSYDPNP